MAKITSSIFFKALGASFLVATLALLGLIWLATKSQSYGGDFELVHKSSAWKLSDHSRDLNILYLGYAKCPDVCPMTLSITSEAFSKLSKSELKKVHLLFLSVDRDNETPEEVAEYASQFFPSFLGLSGSRKQIDHVASIFFASYMIDKDPKSYLGYSIVHTDRLFFLDHKGMVIETIQNPRSSELILETIRKNL